MPDFTASDGVSIAFEDRGSGRPLLLLHGLMAHSGFFLRQRELADDFRLVTLDLRGHGRSPAKEATLTLTRLAEDVAELTERLDLYDAIGVGWSLGASVLWSVLTGRRADRFAGAVIIDMTPRVLNGDAWDLGLPEEICEARSASIRGDFRSFARSAGQAIFAQPLSDAHGALAHWSGEEFARNDPASMDALWSSLVEADFRPALGRIVQPTLVIRGAQSHLYGSGTADHLAASLPDARAVSFARSGHAPHMEEPELFNRTIRDFAAGLPPRSTTETLSPV